MKVYCVMGDEGRSDLDNVNYFGDPIVEVLDVVSFRERPNKKGQKNIPEEEMEM